MVGVCVCVSLSLSLKTLLLNSSASSDVKIWKENLLDEDTLIYLHVTSLVCWCWWQILGKAYGIIILARTHTRTEQTTRSWQGSSPYYPPPRATTDPHSLPLWALPSSLPPSLAPCLPACLSLLISGLNFCPWRAKAQLGRVALSAFVFSLCAGAEWSVCLCV
jgi:hypothetical protein